MHLATFCSVRSPCFGQGLADLFSSISSAGTYPFRTEPTEFHFVVVSSVYSSLVKLHLFYAVNSQGTLFVGSFLKTYACI